MWWIVWAVICCLLFLAIAVGLVVWGIGRGTGSRPNLGDPEEAPLDIARKRLARGELTRKQFEELKETLQGT